MRDEALQLTVADSGIGIQEDQLPHIFDRFRQADGTPVLTDFGLLLARDAASQRLTQSNVVLGTTAYIAPEQIMGGEIDGRTDVYALGAVLHEMLLGYPPFVRRDPYETLRAHVESPLPLLPPRLPPSVRQLLEHALAKQPSHRFPDACAMLSATRAALSALSS